MAPVDWVAATAQAMAQVVMHAAEEPEPVETLVMPMQRLVPIMLYGTIGLVAIFIILTIIRLWGIRIQTKGKDAGNLDLARLRGQRDAGHLSQAEYEAVHARLAGDAPARADGTGEAPIKDTGRDGPERNAPDGEA